MEQFNDVFDALAAAFTGESSPDGGCRCQLPLDDAVVDALDSTTDITQPEQLDRDRLDYSLASLKLVDAYLTSLHEDRPAQSPRQLNATVLRTGAYVGEAIRRGARRTYGWADFHDFTTAFPETVPLLGEESDLGVCAVLATQAGGFTLPVNKVLKFLRNGPEDSVAFYAATECRDG